MSNNDIHDVDAALLFQQYKILLFWSKMKFSWIFSFNGGWILPKFSFNLQCSSMVNNLVFWTFLQSIPQETIFMEETKIKILQCIIYIWSMLFQSSSTSNYLKFLFCSVQYFCLRLRQRPSLTNSFSSSSFQTFFCVWLFLPSTLAKA